MRIAAWLALTLSLLGAPLAHADGVDAALPFWLAPVQVVVAPIVSDADAYAQEVCYMLKDAGLRVNTDLRNEKINYKIREHSVQKVPVIAVVGRKEAEEKTVTLRRLGEERQQTLPLADVAKLLLA